jgi:hypothetical protein
MTQAGRVLALVFLCAGDAFAGLISYVGEVPPPFFRFETLLAAVQTPLSAGDPQYLSRAERLE